jgi:hypothetical protein
MNGTLARLAGTLSLATLLAGCATATPDTRTHRAPGVDFDAYRTFSVSGQALQSQRERELLESWMAEALMEAGLEPGDDPDLEVRYLAFARDDYSVSQVPREELLRMRQGYVAWNEYETEVRTVTEGTLVVDVIDTATDRLVWEGRVTQAIERGARLANRQRIRGAIEALFSDFPRR